MQEIRSSKPPMVTGICDPNKSRARHHRRYIKYFNYLFDNLTIYSPIINAGLGVRKGVGIRFINWFLDILL